MKTYLQRRAPPELPTQGPGVAVIERPRPGQVVLTCSCCSSTYPTASLHPFPYTLYSVLSLGHPILLKLGFRVQETLLNLQ